MIYLVAMLLSHILVDFYFQTPTLRENKGTKPSQMILHCASYAALITFTVWLATFKTAESVFVFLIFFISHLILNSISTRLIKEKKYPSVIIHLLCQTIELLIIVFVFFMLVYHQTITKAMDPALKDILKRCLLYLTAFLCLANPASYLIQKTFDALLNKKQRKAVVEFEKPEEIDGAGYTIGILERFILFIFFIVNQGSAIGFILTAKSVARFKKIGEDQKFAEKYLIGTLLSSAVAIFIGWLVKYVLAII